MSLSCEEVGPQTRTSIAQALDGKEGHHDLLEAGHPQATPCTPKPAGDKLVAGQALLVELLHPSFPGGEDVPVSVRQEKANPERVGRPKPLKDACTGAPPTPGSPGPPPQAGLQELEWRHPVRSLAGCRRASICLTGQRPHRTTSSPFQT